MLNFSDYDRNKLTKSIVHIGVGGFHRSHFAAYIDDLCREGETDWAIVGSGIREGDRAMRDALRAQDYIYTLMVKSERATETRAIGSIVDYIYAHDDHEPLIEQMAHPETRIISLTITEAGYPVDAATLNFLPDDENAGPKSAFSLIAQALRLRKERNLDPVTVLSCDNILHNGKTTRTAVLGEASRIDPALSTWIEQAVSFPSGMVDRIAPKATAADQKWLAENEGIEDQWPAVCEPFRQWVLEDNFASGRPPLERLGVLFTDNVEPYESMKLQLLNAGHTCVTYLASLADHTWVHDAMADPLISKYLVNFWQEEAQPTIPPVPGIDIEEYQRSLLERFSNPKIGDTIERLCENGTAKFKTFVMPTLQYQLKHDGPIHRSLLAIASWCVYLATTDRDKLSFDDHLEESIGFAKRGINEPHEFLANTRVFPADVAQDQRVVSTFTKTVQSLLTNGPAATLVNQV